ncbi:MAG TPA: hypothetical protein VM618_13205 [Acidimicrobiia bacterium]|nr:hypothetical protein [Acidimicrobiia bacterium]
MRRRAALVAAGALLLLLSSCKVDVRLHVDANEDGSGVVRLALFLDEEAVEALGGDVAQRFRIADLTQVGWSVSSGSGERAADVMAQKSFATPEELTAVVRELSGNVGPFRDFRLERSRSRFRTSFEFTGTVDLREGVAASALDPGDEGLTAPLGDLGVSRDDLARYLSEKIDEAFSFEVVADLPGGGSDNAPHSVDGEPAWRPTVGEEIDLRATASRLDTSRVGLLAAALLFGVLALVLVGGRRIRSQQPGA